VVIIDEVKNFCLFAAFTYGDFDKVMVRAVAIMAYLGFATFWLTILDAGLTSPSNMSSFFNLLFYGGFAIYLFAISIVSTTLAEALFTLNRQT